MSKHSGRARVISPLLDMMRRVDANRAGQADLRGIIAGLGDGTPKSEAERRLNALQTELMALNIEMHVRVDQVTGNT